MTSFNHYAFGAIGDWLHGYAAGLSAAAPGYRRIRVRPVPGSRLTRVAARLRTPYGTAASEWSVEGGMFRLDVVVPPNTAAEVFLPFGADRVPIEIGSGSHSWSVPVGDRQHAGSLGSGLSRPA
jgi:alpha-L-rhamnosidase